MQQGGGATHTVVDGHPVVEIGSIRAGRPASFPFPFPFHGAHSLFIQPPPPPRFLSLPFTPLPLLSTLTRDALRHTIPLCRLVFRLPGDFLALAPHKISNSSQSASQSAPIRPPLPQIRNTSP